MRQAAFRRAPDPLRAALMNGFRRARQLGLTPSEVNPSTKDCLTQCADAVIGALVPHARAMTEEERDIVSRADHGCDVEKQRAALDRVLLRERCLFEEDETWFPAEVVELVSHVPSHAGFRPCTALVCLNAVADGDRVGNVAFRWVHNRKAYLAIPEPLRSAILGAVRLIYEQDECWAPSYRFPSECDGRGHLEASDVGIPWIAPAR